eukprot:TRINITY_DN6580_c0_g1_i1.p1 TRINITY_DN6580_c0_g1~~TRINITY_DN6580_c0_g1_i1.p1  ORF type:complete len:189 (-),score=21.77 TRINITY_DN6580_c0_g1_i1:5-571(-)
MSYLRIVTVLLIFTATSTLACRCLFSDIYSSIKIHPDVISGIVGNKISQDAYTSKWNLKVMNTWKGCLNRTAPVVLKSPASSAACGFEFVKGTNYFLAGSLDATGELTVYSCGLPRPMNQMNSRQISFLNNQFNECTGKCATGSVSPCAVHPCSVSNCSVPDSICEDNYCNGCHAWWWKDQYYPACIE